MFSSTKRSRPGADSAESSAKIVWPSTRCPRKLSRYPELPGVTCDCDRHRRLDQARAGRKDLVQEVALHLAHSGRRTWPRWHGPMSRDPTTAVRSTTPGSSASNGAAQGGHDLRHRRRVVGGGTFATRPGRGPRRHSEGASRPGAPPPFQSMRPRRADCSARRPRTVTVAPTTAPARNPA